MKLIITILIFITSVIYAKATIAVSIPPQKYITDTIAKDLVNTIVVVKPGNSPHTYEPKPSQMVALSKAKLYLAIGVEFENAWLPKFAEQNSNLKIVHLDKNITKQSISHNSKVKNDPHIWLSISNLKTIAKQSADALISIDSANKEQYSKNLNIFLEELEKTNAKLKEILSGISPREFLIFHPSWGYFAKEYNLKQIPIEIDGKEPSPKELVAVLKLAKKYKVKAIFTQPEFSQKHANLIAKELNIRVKKVSPLKEQVLDNMLEFANTLKGK
jgi:zinc transport system substrate-binding protein